MINDISGGMADQAMFDTIASCGCACVIMHMKGMPENMQTQAIYENVTEEVQSFLQLRQDELCKLTDASIITDPGFGFGKNLKQNFRLLAELPRCRVSGSPLLVGLSRKSMIYKTLNTTPDLALNGTTALNMAALMGGADILRVHDVKEARETIRLYMMLRGELGCTRICQ